jgi:hypothetical protein
MKLVENWREAYRWFSMWAMSAIGFLSLFLPMLWESLDESTKALIPPAYIGYVLFVVSVYLLRERLEFQGDCCACGV